MTSATASSATALSESALPRLHLALRGELTATEQRIAEHLLLIWPELPFVSAAEIAQAVQVNPSSVTRLCQTLGFRGYPALQRAVRLELRASYAPAALSEEARASAHWARELALMQALSRLPEEQLDRCADRLAQARRVWVCGALASAPAAAYAAQLWGGVRPHVHLLSAEPAASAAQWVDAGPTDLLVAFTVKRYARSTARLLQALTQRGAGLLLISDSPSAPAARQASELLLLPTVQEERGLQVAEGRFVPMTAAASVCWLLTSKLVERLGTERLKALEKELHEQDTYLY